MTPRRFEPSAATLARYSALTAGLILPVIVAPMFLISGPDLVLAASRAGIIGAFPAPNARTIDDLRDWCRVIRDGARQGAPWALNLITHRTYRRFEEEFAVVRDFQPPLLITALGSPAPVVEAVHAYGGLVFADVSTPTYARRALEVGVDGLILLSAGAGGHTGLYNPFALVAEIREFWSGPLVLSGCISNGRAIRAARMLGADLVYMGTRFLACRESLGEEARKRMTVAATLEDVVESAAVTGVPANWLRPSLVAAGFPMEALPSKRKMDFSSTETAKPWKNIWGAGQGVGAIKDIQAVSEVVDEIKRQYDDVVLPKSPPVPE